MTPPARDQPSEDTGSSRARGNAFVPAFAWAVRCGVALWLTDLLLLWVGPAPLSWSRTHLVPTITGLVAGLFVDLCVAAFAGLLLGGLAWLSASPAGGPSQAPLRTRVRAFLTQGTPAQRWASSGAVLALPMLVGAYAVGSFVLTQRFVLGMARPEFIALAILAEHLVLSVLMLIAFAPLRSLGSYVARALGKLPWLGARCFGMALHFVVWLALFACAALGLFVVRYHEALAYLPWHEVGQLALALLLSTLVSTAPYHLPRLPKLIWRTLAFAFIALAALAALSLTPSQMYARHIAEQSLLSGRLAHSALMVALDVDHDGYLPILGGGDCAPFDAARNPGEMDVPGNHIDEDCDGRDLDLKVLPRMGIYNLPVGAEVPERPPIVLLTIDAFAAQRMHALGGTRPLTPNLDKLAQQSALFKSCFSQGPSTRLSFPSIFTSRWDSQIKQRLVGQHPYPIDSSEQMLAEIMRSAGYDTVAVLPDSYFSRGRWSGLTAGFAHVVESPFTDRPALPHDGPRVTAAAIAELHKERTQPLFMWIHYYDAHSPHTQPEDVTKYGTARKDLYDAELQFVDQEVGKLLPEIDGALGGKAVIIVTGDHGIAFEPPRHDKFNYGYDLSTVVLNVPLIIHAPFIKPHAMNNVVSTMDITPTLVNLLRLRGPFPFQGVSLVPELLEAKRSRPPLLMHQMFLEERLWTNEEPLERVALRNDRFSLVHDRKSNFFELYDYRDDYFETKDLALEPAFESTFRDMRQEMLLLMYLTRQKDTLPKRPKDKDKSKDKAAPALPTFPSVPALPNKAAIKARGAAVPAHPDDEP